VACTGTDDVRAGGRGGAGHGAGAHGMGSSGSARGTGMAHHSSSTLKGTGHRSTGTHTNSTSNSGQSTNGTGMTQQSLGGGMRRWLARRHHRKLQQTATGDNSQTVPGTQP